MTNPFDYDDTRSTIEALANPFEPRTQREMDADLYENWAANQPATLAACVSGRRADGAPLPPTCCGGWAARDGGAATLCDPCPPAPADAPAEDDDRVQAALNTIDLEHAMVGRANGKASWLKEARAAQAAEVAAYTERLDRESAQLEPVEPKRATIAPATNRADAIRVIAACEAVAKALREGLTGEARSEYDDNGTRAVYDVTGIGKVVASISQPGIEIEDRDAWMAYAATKWAEEIKMIPTWINPAVEKEILAALVKLPEIVTDKEIAPIMDARDKGEVIGADGAVIPGLAWRTGGTFKAASLTVDPKLKRHMSEVARNYVAGAGPLEIEGGA